MEEGQNGNAFRRLNLRLSPWNPPQSREERLERAGGQQSVITDVAIPHPSKGSSEDLVDAHRQLTYRFLRLPYVVRLRVIQSLGLLSSEDEGVRDPEFSRRVFQRARERGQLASLWEAVEKEYSNRHAPELNPFAKST
jgi:hypothetical protein